MSLETTTEQPRFEGRRVAITGASGQLGRCLCDRFQRAGAVVIGMGRAPARCVDVTVDVADRDTVNQVIRDSRPDLIVHAAAYTDVDGCERDPRLADAVNTGGAANVAAGARDVGAHLISVSTDFVFSGASQTAYSEADQPGPISVYGRSKLHGEYAVLDADQAFAVVRTAWLYGGAGKHFPRTVVNTLNSRGEMSVVRDEVGSPTYADDLAMGIVRLAGIGAGGIFHLVNEGVVSRYEFACAVAVHAGLDADSVRPTTRREFLARFPLAAARPAFSALANNRAAELGVRLRAWSDAVAAYAPQLAGETGINGLRIGTSGIGDT